MAAIGTNVGVVQANPITNSQSTVGANTGPVGHLGTRSVTHGSNGVSPFAHISSNGVNPNIFQPFTNPVNQQPDFLTSNNTGIVILNTFLGVQTPVAF